MNGSARTRPTTRWARKPGGVAVAFETHGPPDAPTIVFAHGIAQSRRSWDALLARPELTSRARLVAVDLRGHGDSAAPPEADAYQVDAPLGADLRAVVDALKLERPILAGWSYGGVAVGEYLRTYGDEGLGGVILFAASTRVGRDARAYFGPGMMDHVRALLASDAATYEAVLRPFVTGCAASPLADDVIEDAVAQMRRVPPVARRALLTRNEDFTPELLRATTPILAIHGTRDEVVLPSLSRELAAARPATTLVELEGVGHLPWIEAPEATERALLAWLAAHR